jgi:hypothetical protein
MAGSNDFGLLSPTYVQDNKSVLVKSGVGKLRGIMVTAIGQGGDTIEVMNSLAGASPDVIVREFVVEPKYYYMGDVLFTVGCYLIIKGTVVFTAYYF